MNISVNNNLGANNFNADKKAVSLASHIPEKSEKLFSTAVKYSLSRTMEFISLDILENDISSAAELAAKECGKDGNTSEENVFDIMAEKYENLKDEICKYYSGDELEKHIGELETGYYNAVKKTFDTIFSEISHPFYQKCCSKEYTGEENILEDMSAKYEKLRTAICEKYSGNDREIFLAQLDSSYDDVSERDIVGGINYIVDEQVRLTKARIAWSKMIASSKEKYGDSSVFKNFNSLAAYENYDIHIYKENSSKWLEIIKNSTRKLVKRSREYIAAGNHTPSNDSEKNSFNDFISNNSDNESKSLSYSDIKLLTAVCGSITHTGNKDNDKLKSIYDNVNKSNLNADIKDMLNSFLIFYVNNNSKSELNNERIDELDTLIKKRLSNGKISENTTDEEKYQGYIKKAKSNNAIDERLAEIVGDKEIVDKVLGEYLVGMQ